MGEDAEGAVLHVDDDPDRAARIVRGLDDRGLTADTETEPAEAVERLEAEPFDCLLTAHGFPGPEGTDLVRRVREAHPDLPVVALPRDPGDATAAVDAGATDYALRDAVVDHPGLLAGRLENALEQHRAAREPREEHRRGEEFGRLVAHDLRNPMAVARGWLEVLHDEGGEVPYRKALDAIQRMDDIIDNLEGLAREGDGGADDERVELSSVATAAWELVDTGGAGLRVEYGPELRADPSLLQQALENCFANAVEHGGGDVTVRVGATDGGFYVADDGEGIDPADRERVFESGYADGGTGLGLAIVRRIAEAHGWQVTATESDAGGARIEFSGVAVEGPDPAEQVPG